LSGQHGAVSVAKPLWQDAEILTHSTAKDMSEKSRFPASDQQFKHSLLMTDRSVNRVMADGSRSITTQQTNTAQTSPTMTPVLSTGQKKRVDVLSVSCSILLNRIFLVNYSSLI